MSDSLDEDLLAVVAHSLLNSMSVISGNAATLAEHWETIDVETRVRFLERIVTQSSHVVGVLTDLVFRSSGEIYLVRHSPRHAWHYFPRMDRHEALVFKQYDSDPQAPRYVPHGAFDLPDIPPDAPLRESIEARCLVVYD